MARDSLDAAHGAQFAEQRFEHVGVVDHDGEDAREKAVVGVYADGAQVDVGFLADNGGEVVDHAQVVVAHDAQRDGVLLVALAGPAGTDDAIAEAFAQGRGVGAVVAVNLDAAAGRDEAKDVVAVDGATAAGQLEVDALEVLVDDEDVVVAGVGLMGLGLERVLLGAARSGAVELVVLVTQQFDVALDELVGVEAFFGQRLVELVGFLETAFPYEGADGAFVPLDFPVLQFALELLAGHEALLGLLLLDGLTYLGAGAARHDVGGPLHLGALGVRGEHFDGVAAGQGLAHGDVAPVDAPADTAVAYVGVDVIGEVEDCGTLGKLEHVAFGREDVHLVVVEPRLELVHQLQVVAGFEGAAYVGEPVVHGTVAGAHALIAPVGGQAVLGDFVHARGAYLNLDPFVLGAEHGDVQAFVSVALGDTEPVAQAFGVGLIAVGDEAVRLPAL